GERNGLERELLARHLVELGNRHLDRLAPALEVVLVDLRVPVEEAGLVDEVLDHEIVAALGIGGDRLDLLEGGDRGADHVERAEIELLAAHEIEEAHVGEGLERAREQASTDAERGDGRAHVGERVEYLHLVGRRGDVDDVGHLGMKARKRATRIFRIEGARRHAVGVEIIEQRARDRGLADAALVGADHHYHRSHASGSPAVNVLPAGAQWRACARKGAGLPGLADVIDWWRRYATPSLRLCASPASLAGGRLPVSITPCWSMIFSENRYPLFGIML